MTRMLSEREKLSIAIDALERHLISIIIFIWCFVFFTLITPVVFVCDFFAGEGAENISAMESAICSHVYAVNAFHTFISHLYL